MNNNMICTANLHPANFEGWRSVGNGTTAAHAEFICPCGLVNELLVMTHSGNRTPEGVWVPNRATVWFNDRREQVVGA